MPSAKCEYMCPESEFYNRNQLNSFSIYETDPSTNQFEFKYAVKDYHRSAADEKTPTSNELRTSKALIQTAAYLIHKIIDDKRGSLDEWYKFIWNRTRAIRKELNQQEIKSELAVRYLCDYVNV